MRLKFLPSYCVIALALFVIFFASGVSSASPSSLSVNVAPENPAPDENTDITLSSYEINLDGVMISWSINGKGVSSGIGKKSFSTKAPAYGGETSIIATLALPEGAMQTRIILRPAVMALLWQANDSYVPPFYRGKAMPSPGSAMKVVAFPEMRSSGGGTIDSKNVIYNWKKDYTNDAEASGYGKNSFAYVNDYLDNSNNISVAISSIDGQASSQADINIGTIRPKIVFYKNDHTLGTLWGEAVPDTHRIQSDETILAVPYFISPKEIQNPLLIWNWLINDSPISVLGPRKNVLPVKVPEGTSGVSKVRLEIENVDKLWQSASKEINIEF